MSRRGPETAPFSSAAAFFCALFRAGVDEIGHGLGLIKIHFSV
jgi:hypothetical protein